MQMRKTQKFTYDVVELQLILSGKGKYFQQMLNCKAALD